MSIPILQIKDLTTLTVTDFTTTYTILENAVGVTGKYLLSTLSSSILSSYTGGTSLTVTTNNIYGGANASATTFLRGDGAWAAPSLSIVSSFVSVSASISTATVTDITSITLSAGTWLISGNVVFALAGGTIAARSIATITRTSVTFPTGAVGVPNSSGEISIDFPYATAASTNPSVVIPTYKYIVSGSPVTFYLAGFVSFSISTAQSGGFIQAVRIA